MDSYTVKSYKFVDGEEQMQEWACGFDYNQAKSYFNSLHNSQEYSTVKMTKNK